MNGAPDPALAASMTIASAQVDQMFETSQEQKKREKQRQRRWTYTIVGTAVSSIIIGFVAVFIEASIVCYLAFLFPFFMGPTVIYQRRQLNKMPTLTQEINLCRHLVNRLMIENTKLAQQETKLAARVGRLEHSEQQLQQIAATNGVQLSDLQTLVHENSETTRRMKKLQNAAELQNILTAMLRSDTNQDRHITEDELERLSQRLQIFSNSQRPVDDGLLRQAFRMSGASKCSTTTLFKLTTDLLEENEREDNEDYLFVAADRELDYLFGGENASSACHPITTTYARCTD